MATSFIFFVVFVSALCYCCCCRKRTHTETTYFQRIISRKISSRAGTTWGLGVGVREDEMWGKDSLGFILDPFITK